MLELHVYKKASQQQEPKELSTLATTTWPWPDIMITEKVMKTRMEMHIHSLLALLSMNPMLSPFRLKWTRAPSLVSPQLPISQQAAK